MPRGTSAGKWWTRRRARAGCCSTSSVTAAASTCRSPRRSAPRSIWRRRGSSSICRKGSMRFDFITIFPGMFEPLLAEGVIARGVKQGLLEARAWDLRDFASDKHRSTDDEAYGGGPGMVMLAEPVLRCVNAIGGGHIVMTTPQGRRFDQTVAKELRDEEWL